MSKLVIAEKPMLARDIARAITGKEVSESARLPISGNGYTVCACAGHLLELVKPDTIDPKWGNPWSLDVLPIEVHDWPKEPAVDKETGESKKPLIDQIAGLLKTCDSVIAAEGRSLRINKVAVHSKVKTFAGHVLFTVG